MKVLLLRIIILVSGILSADLQVFVDNSRFILDGETLHEITYQIPYNKLKFSRSKYGFLAKINVNIDMLIEGKIVYNYPFENNIIVTNYEKTLSNKYYSDKITLTSKSKNYLMRISFLEEATQDSVFWENKLLLLESDAFLSDLEISERIVRDTTKYMEKFHRGDKLYHVSANRIFTKATTERFNYYYEIYRFGTDYEGKTDLVENIKLSKDNTIYKSKINRIKVDPEVYLAREGALNIKDLAEGYYLLELLLTDNVSGLRDTLQTHISIKDVSKFYTRFFPEFLDEIKLIKYFLNSPQKKVLTGLDKVAQKNYAGQFWQRNDTDPQSKSNEFVKLIKERIDYANKSYTVLMPGWKSDRGRIYIKYGVPSDIFYETTDPSKTDFGARNFEIWKYREKSNRTYIFIDRSGNSNLRMIYSENDDSESSLSNWQEYLDMDFDESLLY